MEFLNRPGVGARATLVAVLCLGASGAWGQARPSAGGISADPPGPPDRPNIVFVLLDDVRFDDLGYAGHPFVRTPNIDRIAREGVTFRNAFAATPLCSPNRASILTGQYAHAHGIVDNVDRSAQTHRLVTFPLLLQQSGYETAFIGKWHMGLDSTRRPGFDEWLSIQGQGEYFDPEVNDNGVVRRISGYATDVFTDRAVEFLEAPRDKPFLLYLSHKAVHPNIHQAADGSIKDIPPDGGFTPPARLSSVYAADAVPRRPNARSYAEGKPALRRPIEGLPPLGPTTGTPDDVIRNRLRMLTAADEGLGRILSALEQADRLDETLIVVTSDHGYFYGEHGLNEERRLAYEETARTPLAMRYPRMIKPGSVEDRFVLSVDFAPTFLQLGAATPAANMHGRSLVPLMMGRSPPQWRSSVLIEYFSDKVWPRLKTMGYQAVRTDRWKLIHYTELAGMDEMYDLESDPYEMRNVFGQPTAQATRDELFAELALLLEESGSGLKAAPTAADPSPLTAEDLVRAPAIADIALSPDGTRVVAAVARSELEKNRRVSDLWLLDVDGSSGRAPERLTDEAGNDRNPMWSADASGIYFVSNRSGSDQLWRLELGTRALEQVSSYPLPVANVALSPVGDSFVFSADVFPDCGTLRCTADRLTERSQANVSAVGYENRFVRYFNRWLDDRRSHIFVQALDADGRASGDEVNITSGLGLGAPSIRNERGGRWIVYDASGKSLYFTTLNARQDASWSDNEDIFAVSSAGGTIRNLTESNPFHDSAPLVSGNGRRLVYLSADTQAGRVVARRAKVRDLDSGDVGYLVPGWQELIDEVVVDDCSGDYLLVTMEKQHHALWRLAPGSSAPERLTAGGMIGDVEARCRQVVFTRSTESRPPEIHVLEPSGALRQVSNFSSELHGTRRPAVSEIFSFMGWRGDTVYGRVSRPAESREGQKFPVVFYIHGGPHQSVMDRFGPAWNPNAFTGMGYAFIGIDFHNSVGYGESFAESGRGNWDIAVLDDLKAGLAAALERYPWLDGDRVCAAGPSFGGLYVNWIAGNWSGPFRCFISHGGMFEVRSQMFSMDNQLALESGMDGSFFDRPEHFDRMNPANFMAHWTRPTLITHGEKDYRVPIDQGLAAFGALQRLGIPSRLLVFPDEGHWIQKPANVLRWYREMGAWLDRWLKVEVTPPAARPADGPAISARLQ